MFLFFPISFIVSISRIRSIISRSVASFFNIFTATVVLALLFRRPIASAFTTRPNAPSPRRGPSFSLQEQLNNYKRLK